METMKDKTFGHIFTHVLFRRVNIYLDSINALQGVIQTIPEEVKKAASNFKSFWNQWYAGCPVHQRV